MGFLIAAGGTGQEIAAATLRLSYLSAATPPATYIIDSDLSAATSDTRRTRHQDLDQLHEWLTRLGPIGGRFLKVVNPSELHKGAGSGAVMTLDDVFKQHGTVAPGDRELLDLLFTPQQLRVTVNDGFHGHPAVGAMVVAIASRGGEWATLQQELKEAAKAGEGLRVVVTGSVSGGVGTATLPAVIRDLQPIRQEGNKVFVGGLFQLPWFRLKHLDQELGSRVADVTPAMMDRNATCLVHGYLDQTLTNELDKALILGLSSQVDRTSHGGSQQPETRHYLNVVSGIQVLTLLDPGECGTVFTPGQLCGMTIADSPGDQYGKRGSGPQFRALTLDGFIGVARGLFAFTQALTFEVQSIDPSPTHQGDVYRVLRNLESEKNREDFRQAIVDLHRLHGEIWTWLCDSLHSKVGDNRADPAGLRTFERTETWWTDLRAGPLRRTLKSSGPLPFPPIGREIIRRLGRYNVEAKSTGQTAAWTMVKHARERLLKLVGA